MLISSAVRAARLQRCCPPHFLRHVLRGGCPTLRPLTTAAATAFPELDTAHASNNVPPSIKAFVRGRKLLRLAGHPLASLRDVVAAHLREHGLGAGASVAGAAPFRVFEHELPPVVSVAANFDELLTPPAHASRRPSDTFYVDASRVLRCHMTAHQTALLRAGESAFLMAGDVYRRDTVDATHYPVFHQCDGVRVWDASAMDLPLAAREALARGDRGPATAHAVADLRRVLEGLAARLFGAATPTRWVDASFPFTDPSLELEVLWNGAWLEVLGCGAIKQPILAATGRPHAVGWAFGLGLERLAMVLHGIPDIRLFWSTDPRFSAQFAHGAAGRGGAPVRFEPFSKFPASYRDLAFWLPQGVALNVDAPEGIAGAAAAPPPAAASDHGVHDNDVHALVREAAGDLAESVERIDTFVKAGRTSLCYRINYRATDRTLDRASVAEVHDRVRGAVAAAFPGAELR